MVRQVIIVCAVTLAGVAHEAMVEIETPDGVQVRDAWAEIERDAAAIDTTGEVVS